MRKLLCLGISFFVIVPVLILAADFDGDSRDDVAIFRPTSGLWAIRDVTRAYFGGTGDEPRPGDYDGDGIADIAIFRDSTGLWAVRGVTRAYFGGSGDTPIQGGGAQRIYDYVVKPGDGDDLVAALESSDYKNVFVPAGLYSVSETITVDNVRRITGERNFTSIDFTGSYYLEIKSDHCLVESLRIRNGGNVWYGSLTVNDADHVTIRDCRSVDSTTSGFSYRSTIGFTSNYVTFINCVSRNAATSGFLGDEAIENAKLIGCTALGCDNNGFSKCYNVTGCFVDGQNESGSNGFSQCCNLSSCQAVDCESTGYNACKRISGCAAVGDGSTSNYGFYNCTYVSGCEAVDFVTDNWSGCTYTAACNDVL